MTGPIAFSTPKVLGAPEVAWPSPGAARTRAPLRFGLEAAPREDLVPQRQPEPLPTAPRGSSARALARSSPALNPLSDAGLVLPPYRNRKSHYSPGEWVAIGAAFRPEGSTTRIDRERVTKLAGAYLYACDETSNRHLGFLIEILGARVRRRLAAVGSREGCTHATLRAVLQREYLPARTRLDLIARAVGDPAWASLPREAKWHRIGNLIEATGIIEAELVAGRPGEDDLVSWLAVRKRRRIGLDIAEAVQDHFAAGGTGAPAEVARAVERSLAPEGVRIRRRGPGWFVFEHALLRRPEVIAADAQVTLAWLMRNGRHTSALIAPSYRSTVIDLRSEADLTVAWHQDLLG